MEYRNRNRREIKMGKITQIDLVEQVGKNRKALEMYLTSKDNFYPRHPSYVEDSTLEGFELYWKREIGIVELAEYCGFYNHYSLYKYYESFLNDEDLEFDNDEDLV